MEGELATSSAFVTDAALREGHARCCLAASANDEAALCERNKTIIAQRTKHRNAGHSNTVLDVLLRREAAAHTNRRGLLCCSAAKLRRRAVILGPGDWQSSRWVGVDSPYQRV